MSHLHFLENTLSKQQASKSRAILVLLKEECTNIPQRYAFINSIPNFLLDPPCLRKTLESVLLLQKVQINGADIVEDHAFPLPVSDHPVKAQGLFKIFQCLLWLS